MQPVVVEETFEVKAPVEQVWPFLADTDRMNRRLGLDGVKYERLADPRTPARVMAETNLGGFTTKYEERPWEWTWTRGLSVRRDFLGSPIEYLIVSWRMEAKGAGSALHIHLEAMPRPVMVRPVVLWNLAAHVPGFRAMVSEIDSFLAKNNTLNPFANPKTPVSMGVLERGTAELKRVGVKAEVVERIAKLLVEASDADCVKFRPFELADALGESRPAVLHGLPPCLPPGLP